MTENHSEHFTLISSNVFNAEDIGETLDAVEQIYGSEYGPYDKGKVGFYVSQVGYENIEKVVEEEGLIGIMNIWFTISLTFQVVMKGKE